MSTITRRGRQTEEVDSFPTDEPGVEIMRVFRFYDGEMTHAIYWRVVDGRSFFPATRAEFEEVAR